MTRAAKPQYATLMVHLADMPEPRLARTRRHELSDILAIAICAIICGADGWVDVEDWGNAKIGWLKTFLRLPNGIPSHDTFGRVFAALNPVAFELRFAAWMQAVADRSDDRVVAVDGKTLRGSLDRAAGKTAIHMVSAWAHANGVVLGQVKTDEKSNEITAVPALLQMLDLCGCIVTLDALNTQKDTASAILDKQGDYVMALKGNHPKTMKEVEGYFGAEEKKKFRNPDIAPFITTEEGHGRQEARVYLATTTLDSMPEVSTWPGVQAVVMVERQRTIQGAVSTERSYYLTSSSAPVEKLAAAIRSHWSIESFHWILDTQFDEDKSRVRKDHGPQNFAMLRHVSLNLLKQERTLKVGIKGKRKMAGWSEDYLLKIIGN